ncbi:MAG: hypothetical protein HDS13_02190 [Bacteroides sp.]|nr:hypothetical protein [Bacteroides sp.]
MKTTLFRIIYHFLFSLIITCFSAVFAVGCSDDVTELAVPAPDAPEKDFINITLNCIEGTRSSDYTEEGADSLNENRISSVILCLWPKGGDSTDESIPYVQVFTGVNAVKSVTLRIPLTVALKNKLFPTGAGGKCNAFAAVNVSVPTGEFSVADLRKMAIGSTFDSQRTQNNFAMDGDNEITYYQITNPNTEFASGKIELQRSASKITLALNVDDRVEQTVVVDGEPVTSFWIPNTSEMKVELIGGLKTSTLDPNLDAELNENDFFNTPATLKYPFVKNTFGTDKNPDNGNNPPSANDPEDPNKTIDYPFIQERPFYSYPHRWTSDPYDFAATYMRLSIPWQQVEVDNDGNITSTSNVWRTCYYQVPVIAASSEDLKLVRNVSYHVYLHVGLLGSFIPDEPLELEDMEYSAAEWGTAPMDVTIPDVRYLVVDQNDYTVNNETTINIPFYTSHYTVVTAATMTFYRYNFSEAGLEHPVTVNAQLNRNSETKTGSPVFTADFDNENNQLIVSHDLKVFVPYNSSDTEVSLTNNDGPNVDPWGNNGTANRAPKTSEEWNRVIDNISYFRMDPNDNEYSRVEFNITVQHRDMQGTPNFSETITITQYPGMYIESVTNYYGPENTTSFSCNGRQGNVIVNGAYYNPTNTYYTPSGNNSTGWCGSIGLYSSYPYYNFNPNMYLITITQLPQDTEYRIGDPRSNDINNNLGSVAGATYPNDVLPTGKQQAAWTGTRYRGSRGTVSWDVTTSGFATAQAIYSDADANGSSGNRRTLSYYLPTQEDEAHRMTIAPKFRVCSSYAGTTWIINRELARRRAAAYQEMGYPAGRWRLPTFGEVSFVMELSAQYKIPRLFGAYSADWWYWCAQGLIYVPQKKDSDRKSASLLTSLPDRTDGDPACQRTRFVYDEWYWGEADLTPNPNVPVGSNTLRYTFTWGDKPF